MTGTTWIVAADGTRARIFEMHAEHRLSEIADLSNPEGRANDNEIASYTSGEGRPGPRTNTQEPSAADHSVDMFSKHVADYLETARTQNRYGRVYLIAAPKFLGRLREDVSAGVRQLIAEELDKDISWFNARDIERYLEKTVSS
jgi:protein required for attachment to host cells